MEETIKDIKDSGRIPTRSDIAQVLAHVGAPGKKRSDKLVAVREMFTKVGRPQTNFQGFEDDLITYPEY